MSLIKKYMRKALTVAMAATVGGFAIQAHAAEAPETAPAVSPDSCSAAFATVMAAYMKPELEKQFPADTAAVGEFVRGVAHAFDIKAVDEPYYFGVRNGFALMDRLESMSAIGFPITPQLFCQALGEALKGSAMGFDVDSADAYLRQAMERLNPMETLEPLSPESQQAFIDAQKQREGVMETPSGLLFEVITEGEGPHPTAADIVQLTYTGSLADGTVFDSTDRPVRFPVGNLVPGFTEGLQMMKPGGEYRIFLPPALGYGDTGAADVIPPGAALEFRVHLMEIIPQ